MSKEKIHIIKSPIVPMPDFGDDIVIYNDRVVYYVHLPNGIIATKPEDFPTDDQEIAQEETISEEEAS